MASTLDNVITDDVIKKRLLVDGDGAGDDRKLVSLTKSFMNWCMAEEKMGDCELSLRRLCNQLSHAKYSAQRTHQSIKLNESAVLLYGELEDEVKHQIVATKKEIESSKMLLEEATKLRKHCMEYDAMAKLIESKPDRKITDQKRAELHADLLRIQKHHEEISQQLEDRKKNMCMLTASLEKLHDLMKQYESKYRQPKNDKSSPTNGESDKNKLNSSGDLMEQDVTPTPGQLSETRNVSGVVTSAPVSPLGKDKSDKYEDLSESGEEN